MSAVPRAAAPPADEFEWTDEARKDLEQFVGDVLPRSGGNCVLAALKQRPARHDSFTMPADLLRAFVDRSDEPDLYYAVASFKTPMVRNRGRSQDNVLALRSFYADIDVGPGKAFATTKDALAAVVAAVRAGMPAPTYIVLSGGGGVHLYWCLSEDITPDVWLPVAKPLHAALVHLGVNPDPAVTCDSARVLRLPGSINGKTGERARVLKRTGVIYSPDDFAAKIKALAPVEELPAAAAVRPLRALNAEIVESIEADYSNRPPASFPKIVDHCAALALATADNGSNTGELLWRAMLGIAKHCAEPEHHAHEASHGHVEYDPVGMRAKMDKWDAGPTTCAEFAKHARGTCAACPHNGKIKSPIVLGRIDTSTNTVTAQPKALDEGATGAAETVDASPDLDRMNAVYFVAPDGAGKPCIFKEGTDPETGDPRVVPHTRAEFCLAHENQHVTIADPKGGTKRTRIAAWWLTHPKRREYPGGMGMHCNGDAPAGTYNLWRGFGVEAAPGDVTPMLDHIRILSGGVAAVVAYVLGWLAFCVQHPGRRPEVALIFLGDEGTGKGTLFRLMVKMFGAHGLHITQNSHLVGHFNPHLRWALFVFVDEGYWAGDKAAEGVLKGLITEPTIAIEQKGRDVFSVPNRIALGMATNHAHAVPASANARRYFVVSVPNTVVRDFGYFAKLNAWIDNGGAEAWLHYLQHHDLSGFNVRAVPSTTALDQQKIESLGPLDRWILEALDQGVSPAGGGEWPDDELTLVCPAAVGSYTDYSRRAGGRWVQADARRIGARLGQVFDCGPSKTVQHGSLRPKAWVLPGLSAARAMAARAWGLHHSPWSQE